MSNKSTNNAIGVFDSGLGGLTVLKHFLKELSGYSYIYLGDTARLPYGSKSAPKIYQYTTEALDFLFKQGCHLVIIACNTASAQALRRVQQEYLPKHWPDRKVLGVIRPLAEAAAANSRSKVGVIGTKATVMSRAYSQEIHKLNSRLPVSEQAAPLLVPLIEEGWANKSVSNKILKAYLRPLKMSRVNYLILGCTHYPFLLKNIKRLMGNQCLVPDPGEIVALSLKDYLQRHPELNIKTSEQPDCHFFLTDNPELFTRLGEKFLGQKINQPEKIELAPSKL